MSNENTNYTLNLTDNVIAHIVKLIQLGFITGTDVADHFRMIKLVADGYGKLHLEESYEEQQAANIEKMLSQIHSEPSEVTDSEEDEV